MPSTGSTGDAYERMAESFFAPLEREVLNRRRFQSQDEARMHESPSSSGAGWYNPPCRHSTLGYVSPLNYERRQQPAEYVSVRPYPSMEPGQIHSWGSPFGLTDDGDEGLLVKKERCDGKEKRGDIIKKLSLVLLVIALVVSSGPVLAQNGWYMGMDLGGAVASKMDVKTGGADDWVSSAAAAHSAIRCDKTINPDGFQVEEGACGNAPSTWGPMDESFDGGKGLLAGLALGYRRGAFRAEGEYFYRSAAHESTDVPYDSATNYDPGTDPGFQTVMDGVDAVLSHNVFANFYYDLRSDSKFTPALGVGVGFANASLAYRTLWHRTNDPENITVFDTEALTGDELAKAQALNREIAGTITTDSAKLSALLLGYQAMAGLDYRVSKPVTIGLKFRWASFGEFNDESAYDSLRGHASVAGNPPVPVTYYVKTDDIQFWEISLNMKCQF